MIQSNIMINKLFVGPNNMINKLFVGPDERN